MAKHRAEDGGGTEAQRLAQAKAAKEAAREAARQAERERLLASKEAEKLRQQGKIR